MQNAVIRKTWDPRWELAEGCKVCHSTHDCSLCSEKILPSYKPTDGPAGLCSLCYKCQVKLKRIYDEANGVKFKDEAK